MTVLVVIPGAPVAQGRPRAFRCGAGVRVVDPERSRSWKGAAQVHMRAALEALGISAPLEGPLAVRILAFWPRPKSTPRRLGPAALWRPSRPDADNVGKAVLDAGNGIVWMDDAQVVRLEVLKLVAAEGGAPRVVVEVAPAGEPASEVSS